MNSVKRKVSSISFFFLLLLAAGTLIFVNFMLNQNFNINEKAAPVQNTYKSTQKPKNTPKPGHKYTQTPNPTPTPYPKATACSWVTVTGAESYAGPYNGKPLYYLKSGSTVTLTAETTPTNGWVDWKIASFSARLPNGGVFSSNFAPTVNYTAPINTSGSDQGVEVRGDISEAPNPWIYCPPMTFAIHSN